MTYEELVLDNIGLINKCIKDLHCYWKTEDEYQSFYDSGLEGLVRGAKAYDEAKGYKPSTFLYQCIRNGICREMQLSEMDKRKVNKQSMLPLDKEISINDEKTIGDVIPDPKVNIEEEIETKLEIEKLMYAIDQLKYEKDRIFLCEYYGIKGYKKLKNKEIQEKYNVSHTMINFRLRRAKAQIRKFLEEKKG